MINFIVWLIVGGLVGWIASMIMRTDAQQGVINLVGGDDEGGRQAARLAHLAFGGGTGAIYYMEEKRRQGVEDERRERVGNERLRVHQEEEMGYRRNGGGCGYG
jgi:hypothetical protein